MDEKDRLQFEEMNRKLEELTAFMEQYKSGTLPVSDNQRVLQGLGFIGRTGDTVATGGLIINTPEGPITILRA